MRGNTVAHKAAGPHWIIMDGNNHDAADHVTAQSDQLDLSDQY